MPCSHGYRSPREYLEAAQTLLGRSDVMTWFGRTCEEILKALELWDNAKQPHLDKKREMEQTKMTREEALSKVRGLGIVHALEALGLLKYDEALKPKKENSKYRELLNVCAWAANNVLCTESHVATCVKEAVEEYYKNEAPKKQVEWMHYAGNTQLFPFDYDPGKYWTKVEPKKQVEWIKNGSHSWFSEGFDPNIAYGSDGTWTKVEPKPKKQVEWYNMIEDRSAFFYEGHNPGIDWRRAVSDKLSETLTIYVGTHSHDVSLEAIEKALRAKGYRAIYVGN